MSDFDKLLEEELEKQKKKKNTITVNTTAKKLYDNLRFSYLPSYNKLEASDIAPIVPTTKTHVTDIAPIKTKKEESKLDFFQKGAFDDGYQFGDVTKTILGTAGDVGLGAAKGLFSLGEGVGDLITYGVAGVADAVGKDEYAERVRKKAQESVADKLFGRADNFLNQYSVLGRTSDAIAQGVGQVGGIIATGGIGAAAGLGAAGTTALTTGVMGLSGMGSGMGEAYKGGATDSEATLYGAIAGASDALSELMFGGLGKAVKATGLSVGLSSADDILAKKVSSLFSKQITKNLSEYGVKAAAEGFEEVVAGTAQAIGKKLTYMSEEEIGEILKDENLLEQFVVGAVTSGIAQAPSLHIANSSKTDFITGQTENEQAVIKKEIENRIAEAEQDGKKLTAKQKAKIEAQVEKDMEKGYISTDTIEEVLGGETYQRYKQTVDNENALEEKRKALQAEFDTLNKMKQGEMTGEQIDRRAELKTELAEIKEKIDSTQSHSQKNLLKQQLSDSVSEMVRSDRLTESYNERSRRGQAFEADLTKYDTKQRAVIEKAANSGILNNTNRTHEFVDMVAKISADKGVLFDFTNNEKLKESGFAVDGKTVNGYVTKDGVTLNVQSAKSLNSIVGHEITHVLEGTELYSELQNVVTEYAKTKGEYQDRYDTLSKLYESVEGADIDAEITADMVGDYLFSDSDFINNLSTNHRNVFQKIYDEVKYLLKVATAGSKEAKELEKVKRAFEKAYRESTKVESDNKADTKYSLVTDEETIDFLDNQEHVKVYRAMQVIDGELYPPMAARVKDDSGKKQLVEPTKQNAWYEADERPELMKFEVKQQGKKKRFLTVAETQQNASTLYGNPSPDDVIKLKDGSTVKFGELGLKFELDKANGATVPAAYNPYFHTSLAALNDQFSSAYNRPNLVVVEGYIPKSELSSGYKALYAKDSVGETTWHSGPVASALKGEKARKVFLSRWFKVGRIVSDTEAAGEIAKTLEGENLSIPWNVVTPSLRKALEAKGVSIDYRDAKLGSTTVPFESTKYSLSDSNGRQLSEEQQKFFKDSVVRDENGNLKVMYHGTSKGGHTVFDTYGSNYGLFGTGSYFTDSKTIGESYTKKGKGKAPQVYEAYLNIKKPMDMDAAADPAAWAKAMPDVQFPESGTNEDFYRAMEEYFEDNEYSRWEAAETAMYAIEGMGYDGITHIGGGRVNADSERHQVYIAFQPEQIKSVDNVKPTVDPDIRYSLSDSNGKKLSEEQAEYFKDSVIRDTNGKLMPMYHGTMHGGFTVFDGGKDYWYFTNDKKYAYTFEGRKANGHLYPNTKEGIEKGYYNPQRYTAYLNVTNPFVTDDIDVIEDALYWDKSLAGKLREKGYDALMLEDMSQVIVLNPNQIKNVSNKKPTPDPDIRYSLSEDSEGRKLSENQAKYFKDSKVTDENGNLKVVYHGSPSDFNEFSLEYLGTNGTAEGYGFYFTDKKSIADIYTKGLEGQRSQDVNGKLFEVYLDIKKPLSDTEVTMTRAQFKKFLTTLNKQVDADGEPLDILSNYGDVEWEGLNKVLNYAMEIEYDGSDSDVNLVHSIINGSGNMKVVFDVLRKTVGYDGIIVNEASWGGDQTIYIAFHPEQIKNVDNLNPTADPDIRRSLSNAGQQQKQYGNYNVYGKDIALETAEEVAPVAEKETTTEESPVAPEVAAPEKETTTAELFPDNLDPAQMELENLLQQKEALESRMFETVNAGDFSEFERINADYVAVESRIAELEGEISESESGRLDSIVNDEAPPEMDTPYYGEPSKSESTPDPFMDRDMDEVGKNRKIKAYQYENPEVKPFFQEAAIGMLGDLSDTIPGEKLFNGEAYYASGGATGWDGTKRQTTDDIAWLKDTYGYTYDQIRDGVNAIIEDEGKENNAVSKRIEFLLHDRLVNGYTGVFGDQIPSNQAYIDFLKEKEINEYSREAFDALLATADQYTPVAEDIAPVVKNEAAHVEVAPVKEEYISVTPKRKKEPKMVRVDKPIDQNTANILVSEPKAEQKKNRFWSMFKENVLDNGMVFENLALKTKNRELQAKWNFIRYAQSMAQRMVGNGAENVKSLDAIRKEVEKSGKTQQFYEYLYHWLNVDRMTLEDRFEDTPNKAVFGDSVTADMSRAAAAQLGKANPEFRRLAQDVYRYSRHLRDLMVNNGVISQETADLWQEMYPHYVPIRRVGESGLNINVPLDTGKTGVNAPIKRATGGSSDILPLFDTMAQRTLQTYKAIAKNSFGVELKNTLGTTISKEQTDIDGIIDSVDQQEELLQEGKNGRKPTFTVFENGEKVTFEITDEMYNAMKPTSDLLSYTNSVANTASNIHRGLLTEYNPVFMVNNAIKDTQDILINSQHPVKTYANLPRATLEIAKKGKWFKEYMEHGGEDNTYFDGENNSFDTEEKGVRKLLGIPPLSWISKANNFIERAPRLAEYIASREAGRSIEVSMLDAARVTTNFAAGGKLTKFANRNGATFLNASVQGAVQQARNFREAKANGLKGWLQLAGKFALAGIPAVLLNGLMWDDDDEYEELSDYVKQNYYIVGKYGDGKFVRIPKGRTLAVIQSAIEQVSNAATGNDEVDLKSFLELALSNLAPNNPVGDNILAPIIQVANNETWYGEDLVPTRLQDLPAAEQYDESTDAISKWLGEKLNVSPYKINYILDQYSGGVGDTILPMLTPEAESGDNSLIGNMIAPFKSKFTTDSVMNNQNVSDFYDTKDELTTNANASSATDEDILMNKYINSINAEMSELYAKKREIQNYQASDTMKYSMVREVQKQIDALAKESLNTYKDVSINGEYATVGDRYFKKNEDGEWQKLSDEQVTKLKVTSSAGDSPYATDGKNHYRFYVKEGETEGEWRKITDEQLEKQDEVTKGLGISAADYWGKKEEYDYAYEYPENYAVAKAVGGYDSYKAYSNELYDIKADKDENGKSINGSRKEKVIDYINELDADYYTKIILFKNEYNADDSYNEEIVDYLNGREDISYSEMVSILKKLGFTVSKDGTVTW